MQCAIAVTCATAEIQAVGYIASLLVLITFCMKTMIPLRLTAISSNVAFIVYAFYADLHPILILHSVLLPLNAVRTVQILRLSRLAKKAAVSDAAVACLRPFMQMSNLAEGEIIFRQGDPADRVYLLVSGTVWLEEIDLVLQAGDLFGEIGLFSSSHERTQTARALSNVVLLWMTGSELTRVCSQHPHVSFYFLRLSINRLVGNAARSSKPFSSGRSPSV